MRGMFVLVLVSAVAAGSALLLWDDASTDVQPAPFEPDSAKESVEPQESPDPGPDPAVPTRASALLVGVSAHLAAARPDLAARAVLEAEAGELADPGLRAAVLRTGDDLAASATQVSGDDAIGRRVTARTLYGAVFDCDASTDDELDRAFAGARAMTDVLVTGAAAPERTVLRHKMISGDILWNLAKGPWREAGISVPPGFVLHVNGISDARRIRAGQTLRIPRESLSVLVRKSRFELTLLLGGAPFARFPVGIGANESTPEGTFRIETKIENPDWYFDGRRIPFGDPGNLIGTRWLGFAGEPKAEGIGIHGTTDETSVGRAVSMGCVRMRRADVETLFEWLPYGASVEIR